MLIEFSVENFLSFNERQTLSMRPVKSYKEHEDTHTVEYDPIRGNRLLRSAVMYGPNASGKSNFFKAIAFLERLIRNSSNDKDAKDAFNNYKKFSRNDNPTSFEIIFINNDKQYRYLLKISTDKVISESLFTTSLEAKSREIAIYFRDQGKLVKFNRQFGKEGGIFEKTRSNALYLTTLKDWNHPVAKDICEYFFKKISVLPFTYALSEIPFASLFDIKYLASRMASLEKFNNFAPFIIDFLSNADIGIKDVKIPPELVSITDIGVNSPSDFFLLLDKTIEFVHVIKNRNDNENMFSIRESDESNGARWLFALSGLLIDALQNNNIVFIDELDQSLHNVISTSIINLFSNNIISKSQLIFNTHDTSLLDPDLFRRDQIWFTEKNEYGATQLIPLSDYSPREKDNVRQKYLGGRYGAVPVLSSFGLLPKDMRGKNGSKSE